MSSDSGIEWVVRKKRTADMFDQFATTEVVFGPTTDTAACQDDCDKRMGKHKPGSRVFYYFVDHT